MTMGTMRTISLIVELAPAILLMGAGLCVVARDIFLRCPAGKRESGEG